MTQFAPSKALFIKLGRAGDWERICIEGDPPSLRLGYQEVDHDLCLRGEWDLVRAAMEDRQIDPGAATRHANQIRWFYEAGEDVLWITFFGDKLYWCRAKAGVYLENSSKLRQVLGSWLSEDLLGKPLIKSQISGKLLAVQGFRGTICEVRELDYLINKIRGTQPEEVERVQEALSTLEGQVAELVKALHWADFEILVDLIFRQAGWQRVSQVGGAQKGIDLELLLPMTAERCGVQVKSRSDLAEFRSYELSFADTGFARRYFVVHSPDRNLTRDAVAGSDVELWLPEDVSRWVVKNGLVDWLLSRVS